MQAGKSQRSVLALVITCALILGFGIPLIPLVGVDSITPEFLRTFGFRP